MPKHFKKTRKRTPPPPKKISSLDVETGKSETAASLDRWGNNKVEVKVTLSRAMAATKTGSVPRGSKHLEVTLDFTSKEYTYVVNTYLKDKYLETD